MVDRVESVSLNRQQSAGGATTGSVLNARDVKAWQDAFEFLNEAEKQFAEQRRQAEEAASRLYASERARGYEDGKAEATSLVTETALRVDRYLQSTGKRQIFGTQIKERADHTATLEPYNRDLVSDSLRRELGVLPIAVQEEQLQNWTEQFKAAAVKAK